MDEPQKPAATPRPNGENKSNVRTISSDDLLQGERQVVILHHGDAYRLLVTRNDKLLLQK
jgi:hemin uptake protein HemP